MSQCHHSYHDATALCECLSCRRLEIFNLVERRGYSEWKCECLHGLLLEKDEFVFHRALCSKIFPHFLFVFKITPLLALRADSVLW